MPTKPTIQDQTFLFTGTLTEFTRDEAEALVEVNGGKVISGVTAKLNYLVVGEDAGSKLDKAKKLGTVKILTEKEFLKMVPSKKSDAREDEEINVGDSLTYLKGKKIVLPAGLLPFEVADIREFLLKNGAVIIEKITSKTDMLIVEEAVYKYSWTSDTTNLEKAKKLNTVEIISDKEFRKKFMKPSKNQKSKLGTNNQSNSSSSNLVLSKNTIYAEIKFAELKKIILKYSGTKTIEKSILDEILDIRTTISSYDDIDEDCKSIFYFDESIGQIIINNKMLRHSDNENSDKIVELADSILCEGFFSELSKKSKFDFKVHFLIKSFVERLGFCVFNGGEFYFEDSSVENWEDPDQFEAYPYFVKLAKGAGMKKVKNDYDEKLYDSEEVYNVICDFRNNLYDSNTYLNIAPDEYLKMKSIPD
jgi:hypothetical protein